MSESEKLKLEAFAEHMATMTRLMDAEVTAYLGAAFCREWAYMLSSFRQCHPELAPSEQRSLF